MKNYGLYTKGLSEASEIILKIQAVTLEEAISTFALIKKLPKKSILEIYEVSEIITISGRQDND